MQAALIDQAIALPADERIELIGRLWDSLLADGHEPPLSAEMETELARRTARLEATGPQGEDWSVVKARLLGH